MAREWPARWDRRSTAPGGRRDGREVWSIHGWRRVRPANASVDEIGLPPRRARPTELRFGYVIAAYRISIRYGKDADIGCRATGPHPRRGRRNVCRARIRRGEDAGRRSTRRRRAIGPLRPFRFQTGTPHHGARTTRRAVEGPLTAATRGRVSRGVGPREHRELLRVR